ncbi:MAG TPA: hypothetical protein VHO70_20800 [Chitinispirillaceae bacterium]|nr:hypothetical protein [Chitinispirillaceae bacterium]
MDKGVVKELLSSKRPRRMMAGGSVEVALDGQFFSGSADIRSFGDTVFKINVYSILGASVLQFDCGSERADVMFQDSNFQIDKSDTMDQLPYEWAKRITVEQFIGFLQSNFEMLDIIKKYKPQFLEGKRDVKLIWEDSVSRAQLVIHKRTGSIAALLIQPDKNALSDIRISDFSGATARKYKFFDDNRNYFSIHYDKVRFYDE